MSHADRSLLRYPRTPALPEKRSLRISGCWPVPEATPPRLRRCLRLSRAHSVVHDWVHFRLPVWSTSDAQACRPAKTCGFLVLRSVLARYEAAGHGMQCNARALCGVPSDVMALQNMHGSRRTRRRSGRNSSYGRRIVPASTASDCDPPLILCVSIIPCYPHAVLGVSWSGLASPSCPTPKCFAGFDRRQL